MVQLLWIFNYQFKRDSLNARNLPKRVLPGYSTWNKTKKIILSNYQKKEVIRVARTENKLKNNIVLRDFQFCSWIKQNLTETQE